MLKKINFRYLLLLIIISVFLGIFYNLLSPSGIPFMRENIYLKYAEPELNKSFDSLKVPSESNIVEPSLIMTEAAFALYDSQKILFIDARDHWDFNEARIKGAINIPEYKFDINLPIVKALDKDFTFIIYCSDVECDVSKRLAIKLSKLGFSKIYILEGGINNWIDNNYPMEQN